jgi:hypothetical protein
MGSDILAADRKKRHRGRPEVTIELEKGPYVFSERWP